MARSPRHLRADHPFHRALVAGVALIATLPAVADPTRQESKSMPPSLSRIPAPQVAPIEIDGVRYEQVRNGLLAGFDQMGGWLAAVDVASGQQSWVLKVYDNRRNPALEGDVQDVFFRTMTRQADGTLLIENERRARFVVDVATRSVQPAP